MTVTGPRATPEPVDNSRPIPSPSWMENQPLACPYCGHPDADHESLFLGGKCLICDDCEGWA